VVTTQSPRREGRYLLTIQQIFEGGTGMPGKRKQEWSELSHQFAVGIVLLAALLLTILIVWTDKGEATERERASQQQGLRASKIIDAVVKNDRGEEVGEVDDLIMSRNGKVKKVILSVGGFLKIGEKLVAVPLRSLQITERGDILYNITKEEIEKHPRFNYKEELPYEDYYSSYRNPSPPFQMGTYGGRYSPWEWAYFPSRLSVSAILNRTVLNNKGEELGDIDDLMINREGRIEEVILAVGGFKFMEMGEKLVALPFKPLKITDLGILYNITVQQLKNLPEFSYERRRP
jgi:sporulation protein YlmC with PRC-barrel domain